LTTENKPSKGYLFFIATAAALGGFLFGYDTAVISGTITMVKNQFALNVTMEGWFVSSALLGCIAGVAFAGELSDRMGRKLALLGSAALFLVSAIGCMLSETHSELILFRLLGGVGVGIASMLSPLYISEVSPARIRGRMVALYQFAITLGILVAYFVNARLLNLHAAADFQNSLFSHIISEEVWRAMFGSEMIPALVFFISLFFVPESPRWYALKDKREVATNILARINGRARGEKEMAAIMELSAREKKGTWKVLMKPGFRVAVIAGVILAILSQFTGINAIIYYGPRIMEQAGLQLSDALGGQVIIGFVNVAATIFAIWKIDQFGRKKLMLGGITGMMLSLVVISVLFFLEYSDGFLILAFILVFIASFAIGYGPVIWVLLSEIYPARVRGRAMSVATLALWLGTAIIGQVVPWLLDNITPAGTFILFAAFCIPVPFILKRLPETKGISLEEIENHWKNMTPDQQAGRNIATRKTV
jgi:sugar porter (SP) family MFS transporter